MPFLAGSRPMRREAIAAIAFAGGLALAIIAMTPPEGAIGMESLDARDLPAAPLTTRQAQRGIEAPEWEVGDAWLVSFDGGDPMCWLVVAVATEEGYRQGVTCDGDVDEYFAADIAARGNGFAGSFSRDLEGLDEGDEVRWFDWPLTDGKTWSTSLGSFEVDAIATFTQVEGAEGEEPGYTIEMTDPDSGTTVVTYDFVPSLAWWSHLTFPQSDYTFRVLDRTDGWSDPVVYGIGRTAYEQRVSFVGATVTTQPPFLPSFEVAEAENMLVVYTSRQGVSGGHLSLRDPGGNERFAQSGTSMTTGLGSSSYPSFELGFIEGAPGTWTLDHEHVGANPSDVLVAAVELATVEP